MNIHFGPPLKIRTIADALPLYGDREFESPTRSTIPMLTLLKDAPDLFSEIVSQLRFPATYDLFLEYTVGPFGGRGKASHTDVMLTAGKDYSLAIEAKWTEPMYEDVKDWPKKGATKTPNQKAVLKGWLDVLAKRLNCSLDVSSFDGIVYQMIHRAASAAFTSDSPRLAYFLFKPSPDSGSAMPDAILGKLEDLWTLLGKPEKFPFYVVEIETTPTEDYTPLRSLAKGEGATAEAVVAALRDSNPLFKFGGRTIRQVGQEIGK
jgi:hypothetical protein